MHLQARRLEYGIVALFFVGALLLPAVVDSRYVLTQSMLALIWLSVVSQWNVTVGIAGIFSLAQLAIFGVGGYSAAFAGFYFDVSLWHGLWIGGIAATIFGMLLGIACLRLKGVYVALLTFCVSIALYQLIITDTTCFTGSGGSCKTLTGGARGMSRFGDFGFKQWLGKDYRLGTYYLAYMVALASVLLGIFILRSPLGKAFKALKDNYLVAECRGISLVKYQLITFLITSFLTGMAGVVYAGAFKVIGPSVYSMPTLSLLVSMMVVGGLGSGAGPIFGVVSLMLLDEAFRDFSEFRTMALGFVITACIVLFPDGIAGRINTHFSRIQSLRRG